MQWSTNELSRQDSLKMGKTGTESPTRPKNKVSITFDNDPVAPERIVLPTPPRERLMSMLTTYKVDAEKEVYNITVSKKVLESLTPQEIRDLRVVFDAFDVNSDGLLPLVDVRRSLLSLGFKVSKGEVRNMMADADLGQTNGEANFNTFLEFVIDKQGDSRDSVDELEKSFKLFDLEHSGKLTVPSLRALCRQFEVNLKDDELLDMVREADKNGDGAVDRQEFIDIMMKTNLFL